MLRAVTDQSRFGENAGIRVGKVTQDSRAWRLGLRMNDVIFEVNRQRIKTLPQLRQFTSVWHLRLRRGEQLLTFSSR